MGRRRAALTAAAALLAAAAASAETSAEARARAPALFDAEGLRIERQRAPTPTDVPGGRVLDPPAARQAQEGGALFVDVSADESGVLFEGEWVGFRARETIPGAVWLPRVGFAAPEPEVDAYFREALARLTGGDAARPVVFFCIADCWLSWNAVQKAATLGYGDLGWMPLGTDGWRDMGWPLSAAEPYRLD